MDSGGNAYVTGRTSSSNFPTATSHHVFGDSSGSFVVKLNSSGSALIYSAIIGASGSSAIAVDSSGSAYLTGGAGSTGFPIVNAFQSAFAGTDCVTYQCANAFVSKLDPAGTGLVYSTYLGGNKFDAARAIALDASGNVYLTGRTTSTTFPTRNPIQAENHGGLDENFGFDAFVAKLDALGGALVYSTYLGGDYDDSGSGIAVDSQGNAYVVGMTESPNFPIMRPFQPASGGHRDGFIVKLNPEGSAFEYSSYLGGSTDDSAGSIALDSSAKAYVTGYTFSKNFPTVNAFQASLAGGDNVFVTKIYDEMTSFVPASFFVPIVLSASGMNNSFFTSELTLTNRGPKDAEVEFTYTAAFGGGSGKVSDTLQAGHQRVIPDAIAYLKSLGIPIPESGNRGGTLAVRFSDLATYSDVGVAVRTTTAEPEGRAGLAYSAVPIWNLLTGPSFLCGLRQNATDRSNVAIQNAGTEADGDISLRLTVYSGDPAAPFVKILPDEKLSPGAFKQFSGILQSGGSTLANGYVRVERVSGTAPYYAYGVVNDQVNSDGSFVPPLYASDKLPGVYLTLPVVLETHAFTTEVVLTNVSGTPKTLNCSYVFAPSNRVAGSFTIELNAGEQSIIPNFVQYLRDRGVADVGPPGPNYVGTLRAQIANGDVNEVFLGARTSTPRDGGRYGVFYTGQAFFTSANSAWIYGLQQNSENRTNLAIVNTNDSASSHFDIDIFDGETGLKLKTVEDLAVNPSGWMQINRFLDQYAPGIRQGYVRVRRRQGALFFITYAVINDGAAPGERTGDGALISSLP
ncbi:MAG: hypothetical protein DMG06_28270 [Acidobacteria bacterium]|nr:MAG: hypothetical protein DMG06_28270 [Acidobacteriota bacterium]